MRKEKNIKKKAGVSAVIGVVLMVAITVAIAAIVYVYVKNTQNYLINMTDKTINVTGKLYGIVPDDDAIVIGNNTYYNVSIYTEQRYYLYGMLGQNVTIILIPHIKIYDDTVVYHYEFIWAYVN